MAELEAAERGEAQLSVPEIMCLAAILGVATESVLIEDDQPLVLRGEASEETFAQAKNVVTYVLDRFFALEAVVGK